MYACNQVPNKSLLVCSLKAIILPQSTMTEAKWYWQYNFFMKKSDKAEKEFFVCLVMQHYSHDEGINTLNHHPTFCSSRKQTLVSTADQAFQIKPSLK